MPRPKPDPATEPLRVGERLSDRYYIVERIAAGGHSIVYRGEDERLSRPVCVKVFHRLNSKDGVYQTAYEHFVQEAFALSKLTHPNTLRIYDFGYLAGRDGAARGAPYQVSEFMNHGTLSSMVKRRGPMSGIDASNVIAAIGGALSEAHQCGIIHRDIKPQNILFSKVGRSWVAKLADFGIAKSLGAAEEMLQNQAEDTAVVAGRPLLMYSLRWAAPEQLLAQPVVQASDIYSLALSFVYMFTGNAVFVSRVKKEARRQRYRSDHFIDSAFAGHTVPAAVIDKLKKACSFDYSKRPDDVDEFTNALVEALSTPSVRAPSPVLQAVPSEENHPTTKFQKTTGTSAAPRRLHPSNDVQPVSDRRAYFIPASGGTVDVTCAGGQARLRLSFVPAAQGFSLHIKGLSAFLARAEGRPSGAVQFEEDGRFDILAPDLRPIANVALSLGSPAAGHRVFTIGTESVAISTDLCPKIAALDFGANGDCLFVYVPMYPGG